MLLTSNSFYIYEYIDILLIKATIFDIKLKLNIPDFGKNHKFGNTDRGKFTCYSITDVVTT